MRHYLDESGGTDDMPTLAFNIAPLPRLDHRLGDESAHAAHFADECPVSANASASQLSRRDPRRVRQSRSRRDRQAMPRASELRANTKLGRRLRTDVRRLSGAEVMTTDVERDDWLWVATIGDIVARRARDLLAEIVKNFDETRSILEISSIPFDAPPNLPIGTDQYWINEQVKIAFMLRNRGVIKTVKMANDFSMSVEADESIVREAYRRLSERLQPAGRLQGIPVPASKTIFIGHGQSSLWRALQDFLQNRLNLNCVEFNRVSAAGIPTAVRLGELLDQSGFAFLVMTAEDVHEDSTRHARENVIHEAGLFQGWLGFRRAIILLEDGCEEFSNIEGLGQIRFPARNISAVFEEIRQVLEREKVIS